MPFGYEEEKNLCCLTHSYLTLCINHSQSDYSFVLTSPKKKINGEHNNIDKHASVFHCRPSLRLIFTIVAYLVYFLSSHHTQISA